MGQNAQGNSWNPLEELFNGLKGTLESAGVPKGSGNTNLFAKENDVIFGGKQAYDHEQRENKRIEKMASEAEMERFLNLQKKIEQEIQVSRLAGSKIKKPNINPNVKPYDPEKDFLGL